MSRPKHWWAKRIEELEAEVEALRKEAGDLAECKARLHALQEAPTRPVWPNVRADEVDQT